jgi:hypothetical protein
MNLTPDLKNIVPEVRPGHGARNFARRLAEAGAQVAAGDCQGGRAPPRSVDLNTARDGLTRASSTRAS